MGVNNRVTLQKGVSESPSLGPQQLSELPEAPGDNLLGALARWAGVPLASGFPWARLQPPTLPHSALGTRHSAQASGLTEDSLCISSDYCGCC